MLPTLAHHPRQPRWHITHASTNSTPFPKLVFRNSGILLKGTTTNSSRQGEGILNFLRPSMSAALPPVKSVLTPLAKSVLLP